MAYCMYLRKSRADDEAEMRGEGETLARHEDALLALSKKLNLSISTIYREIVSGETISSRPVILNLLNEVEKGYWEGVLVMEIERLARGDTIDQGIIAQTFKYSNTKIITPAKIYNPQNEFDEEYFEFGLFMSRREYKTINRRLNQGRIASIYEGKYIGSKPPFGYKRVKLQNEKGYTLKIQKKQANIVKLIFEYYTLGKKLKDGSMEKLSCSNIAKELNDLKIKTSTGVKWSYQTITSILKNPVYIGKIKWGNRAQIKKVVNGEVIVSRPRKNLEDIILVDGLHEKIISNKQFYIAQDILNNNTKHTTPAKYIDKNPLAGLVLCADCGKKMSRRPYKNNYPDVLLCQNPNCKNASSSLILVENAILKALETHLKSLKISVNKKSSSLTQDKSKQGLIKSNNAEIKKLKTQQTKLYDLLEQNVYTKELFIERNIILNKKIDELNTSNELLKKEIDSFNKEQNIKNIVIPNIQNIIDVYNSCNVKQKQMLLHSVIEKAVYKKQSGGRWKVAPDDFTIEIYPKI